MSYLCPTCGKEHDGLPDVVADRPDHWWAIPADERVERIHLTRDTCAIDDNAFYIRGVIEIPLNDVEGRFGFGVWISQSAEHFQAYVDDPDSSEIGPFFGWLSTRLKCYAEETINLKARAHFQGRSLRPLIEVEPTDHPLAVDQRSGIDLARAWDLVHRSVKMK
jgi:hypothetical protein